MKKLKIPGGRWRKFESSGIAFLGFWVAYLSFLSMAIWALFFRR